jgi:hypothetical protein
MSWLGGSAEEPKPTTMGAELVADPFAVRRVERQGTIEIVKGWERDDLDDDERERQLEEAPKTALTASEVHQGLHPLTLAGALERIENAHGRVVAAPDGVLRFEVPQNLPAVRRREVAAAARVLDASRGLVWRCLSEQKPLPDRVAAAG